ncbi:MAG: hypothetical protein JXJ22_11775 [Bacteroidales bacterium]|nr:hypothetical protein [Bacteroidales bacterium]
MRQLTLLLTMLLTYEAFSQIPNDSIYSSWWENKNSSIFNSIDSGQFDGNTYGYLKLNNSGKIIVLDFQSTKTILDIDMDPNKVYDNSIKRYSTQTTSGKTFLTYETYALANILTIMLNGEHYRIGTIDGASDMPIIGMTFNYCNEKTTEYLTLFVNNPLELTTTRQIMKDGDINYLEAKKIAKKITLFPGSTLIVTISK